MFSNDATINFLVWTGLIAGIVVLIAGSGIFVMWIYYSWIRRENSANYSGADLTEKMFNKAQINPEIKNSFFYVKYWNNNQKRNTYKLRPWTYSRKSIWTMMEASQQSYATIIRTKQPKAFWMAFRLPGFIKIVGTIASVALFVYAIIGMGEVKDDIDISNFSTGQWFVMSMALGVLIITLLMSEVWMIWILRRDVPKYLEDSGLNQDEINAIKRIFTWRLVYAIARIILEVIRIVIQIASKAKSGRNSKN